MGQKAHPIGQRLGFIKGWDSNWFGGKNYTDKLVPQVAKWATKLEGQVKLAIPMYLDGLESAEDEQKELASAGAKGAAKRKTKAKREG